MLIPPQAPEHVSRLDMALDVIDKATKILAVVIGGAWAYVNYVRGRTYKKRLEAGICAEWFESNGTSLLSGSAHLKNVGLSKFPIEQKGTAILLYELRPSASKDRMTGVIADLVGVRSVFEDHGWIEPGETIEESFLLQLGESRGCIGIKLALRVVAAHIEWNANCILKPVSSQPSEPDRVKKPSHRQVAGKGEAMIEREKPAENLPGTPESSVPVNTQITERRDITDDIERRKTPTLGDPGDKPLQRFD